MSNTPVRRKSAASSPQALGILPTRGYWDGRKLAPVRAALAGTATAASVAAVSTFAPTGLPLWATAAMAGLGTVGTITLVWGLTERLARKTAER